MLNSLKELVGDEYARDELSSTQTNDSITYICQSNEQMAYIQGIIDALNYTAETCYLDATYDVANRTITVM